MKITSYKVIFPGNPAAEALASPISLSFWGGVNPATGMIQDVHHTLCGQCITGKILCIPYDRGSCSTSGIMLEMIRQGTGPLGILCIEAEAVLALGAIIGDKMYNRGIAIRTVSKDVFSAIPPRAHIAFTDNSILIDE